MKRTLTAAALALVAMTAHAQGNPFDQFDKEAKPTAEQQKGRELAIGMVEVTRKLFTNICSSTADPKACLSVLTQAMGEAHKYGMLVSWCTADIEKNRPDAKSQECAYALKYSGLISAYEKEARSAADHQQAAK